MIFPKIYPLKNFDLGLNRCTLGRRKFLCNQISKTPTLTETLISCRREKRESFTLWKLSYSCLLWYHVKIQYAKIDNICIQFNFTIISYARSLKEIQPQDRHKFILGNPLEGENPTKLPQHKMIKSTKIKPQTSALPPCRYVSLSPMRYTQVSVCVQMRNTPPLFILFLTLDFFPNQVGPNKLTWSSSPRKSQNNIILYSRGFYWPHLQQRFYFMNLWWPNTIVTSRQRNKTSSIGYTNKIHLEFTIFQHFLIWKLFSN